MNTISRAVVFDLDGTLVDSMPLVMDAYAHALAPYVPAITSEQIREMLGGPPDRFFSQIIAKPEDATAALERLNAYVGDWRLIRPFAGMVGLLKALRAASLRVGVWTGRERESTEVLLREHGVSEMVEACVCGDDLPSHKPDPAGLVEVLRQLGVEREQAWFVGDADVDVLAGSAIGVRTLLITHERRPSAELQAKAWRVVATPAEAYAVLHEAIAPK